ncbi:MAG TPA: SAM-dependent methyltransferase, partial [Desulfomicrobiaceae bacterium]|nr:SAM-dependent methyltransferase [Desulfomicrobiaceae bacterium]
MRSSSLEAGRKTDSAGTETDRGTGDRGRGRLTVVGLGPGDPALLAPMALEALRACEVIVGYTTYVGLISKELLASKEVLSTGMRREMDRAVAAVDRAGQGRDVVV